MDNSVVIVGRGEEGIRGLNGNEKEIQKEVNQLNKYGRRKTWQLKKLCGRFLYMFKFEMYF